MKKQTLEKFIRKYSLNGLIQSVKFVVKASEKKLTTSAITEEKNVLIFVTLDNFDAIAEECELGVYQTSILSKMVSVLGEEITLTLNKTDDKIISVNLEDGAVEAQFVTADLAVIPATANLKKIPEYNVEIALDADFVSKFIKAKNALPDVDIFTLLMNKKKTLDMVIGYSMLNSNRITLALNPTKGKDAVTKNINFSAKYFKEILSANSECDNAILKVSDAGLATVTFTSDNFVSTYHMVEIKTKE
jgi:hypothetical protein